MLSFSSYFNMCLSRFTLLENQTDTVRVLSEKELLYFNLIFYILRKLFLSFLITVVCFSSLSILLSTYNFCVCGPISATFDTKA